MNKLFFGILTLFIFCVPFQSDEKEKVKAFAFLLREMIIQKDIYGLEKVFIYPNNEKDSETLSYMIGDSNYKGFSKIMKNIDVKIAIHGPIKYNNVPENLYYISYYNPKIIKKRTNGTFIIKKEELYKYWGTSFLMTEVIISNNDVLFYKTPFYYETEISWLVD